MNRASHETRVRVLQCLTDGVGVRATCRIVGVSKGMVLRLLREVGQFCELFQYHRFRSLPCRTVQMDEQWSFIHSKQRNATQEGHGDIWLFTALDADTKLAFAWIVGDRTEANAVRFVQEVASRCTHRIQLSSDGYMAYLTGVRKAFSWARVDYGQVTKEFGKRGNLGGKRITRARRQTDDPTTVRKYSPDDCLAIVKVPRIGRPEMGKVSTSYIERVHLETRQRCRRFTRLTSGFSKLAENHTHAVALNYFCHNYCRPHGTLSKAAGAPTTPAMASGLTPRVWTLSDLLQWMGGPVGKLLRENEPTTRGIRAKSPS